MGKEIKLTRPPGMGWILIKGLIKSLFRPGTVDDPSTVEKAVFILNRQVAPKALIHEYRSVCGFGPSPGQADLIPACFIQTLFVPLLGKYITSACFPISPLGLIHTLQTIEQLRPVETGTPLDLACRLESMVKTDKGTVSTFSLTAATTDGPVWTGEARFLSRNKTRSRKTPAQDHPLPIQETIMVPKDTGRRYAGVSGDINPHHLWPFAAKRLGFKRAIAHGMWSLARATASLEQAVDPGQPLKLTAVFKLPVFLPGRVTLGYEPLKAPEDSLQKEGPASSPTRGLSFELRDAQDGRPHLKGVLVSV